MIIEITPEYRVHIDKYKNHQPEFYREGGQDIKVGLFKGGVTKEKWVREDKHFKYLSQAIYWGVENGYLGVESKIDETMTLQEYIDHLKNIEERAIELCDKVIRVGEGLIVPPHAKDEAEDNSED